MLFGRFCARTYTISFVLLHLYDYTYLICTPSTSEQGDSERWRRPHSPNRDPSTGKTTIRGRSGFVPSPRVFSPHHIRTRFHEDLEGGCAKKHKRRIQRQPAPIVRTFLGDGTAVQYAMAQQYRYTLSAWHAATHSLSIMYLDGECGTATTITTPAGLMAPSPLIGYLTHN